jgi:hypothetical protein
MPKAKPLPKDPARGERVKRLRAATVRRVALWRKRHPKKARELYRDCAKMRALRLRLTRRRAIMAG